MILISDSTFPGGLWKSRLRRAVLACSFLLALLILPAWGQENATFSTSLTSGTAAGTIPLTFDGAVMEKESSGVYHLLLDRPGASTLKGTFELHKVPAKMYIQISHRTSTICDITNNPTYGIYVNGQKCNTMEIYFNIYTILGYEITPQCRQGLNEFSINLESTAKTGLWIRQIDISPVVSFVEQYKEKRRTENFYLLIPLYLAYFFLIAITISYLLFVIMWRNHFDPQVATFTALFICGLGFLILPFLIFGFGLYTSLIALLGLIFGILWIIRMHH